MTSKLQRLFVRSPLQPGAQVELGRSQAHYLTNVLRCKAGDEVLLFNGEDGEWRGAITALSRRALIVTPGQQTRPQGEGQDLHYLFAPLKRARLDYMAQKATELGASLLKPVITRRTVAERVNLERLEANAIEAAEQCGILRIPEIVKPERLDDVLRDWQAERLLIFADESATVASPVEALSGIPRQPLAVLIGPEGGFDTDERAMLHGQPFVLPISLGPRLMRADTAGVAALSLVNAVLGDWR